MRDPANAVKLEPGAVPMLLVYTSKGPMDDEHAEVRNFSRDIESRCLKEVVSSTFSAPAHI